MTKYVKYSISFQVIKCPFSIAASTNVDGHIPASEVVPEAGAGAVKFRENLNCLPQRLILIPACLLVEILLPCVRRRRRRRRPWRLGTRRGGGRTWGPGVGRRSRRRRPAWR